MINYLILTLFQAERTHSQIFFWWHMLSIWFQLNLLFVFLYCSTTAITSRGGFTEAIFYCFTVWSLCSVLIASYISTKHMHLDAMKKWYKLSKSLAIWFPCLQSIIMESLDIQKWEIKRLIKKDFSHGTLSHMSEFFPSFFFLPVLSIERHIFGRFLQLHGSMGPKVSWPLLQYKKRSKEWNHFLIPALAPKKGSNQKSGGTLLY